jgi:hypothetical protein
MIKSRRMGLAVHVECMGTMINTDEILVGKREGKRPIEKQRHRRRKLLKWI